MPKESADQPREFGYQDINPELAKAADSITPDELKQPENYSYKHEILWYGIDAIVHAHFFRLAREVAEGRMELSELLESFQCDFDGKEGFMVSARKLSEDGIFIPTQRQNKEVRLLTRDYRNKNDGVGGFDVPETQIDLMNRKWKPEDLRNPGIVKMSGRFARDLWTITRLNFESLEEKHERKGSKINGIGEELIRYYEGIIQAIEGDAVNTRESWTVYSSEALFTATNKNVHFGPPSSLAKRIGRIAQTRFKPEELKDGKQLGYEVHQILRGTRTKLVKMLESHPEILI